MTTNANKPAYPLWSEEGKVLSGLTRREAFAMAAMQGYIANSLAWDKEMEDIARWSVKQADALIAALDKKKEDKK